MMNKTGLLFSMMILLGGIGAAPLSAMADDNRRGRHDERRDYEGRHEYRPQYQPQYHHERYDSRRVVYYAPSYSSRYQTIYYSPWQANMSDRHMYRVGDYIPRYVRCYDPSRHVVAVLPPAYRGTRYVQVDDSVYLVSEASRQILNAIVLLSGAR